MRLLGQTAFLRFVWTEKQVEVERGDSYIRGISAFVIFLCKVVSWRSCEYRKVWRMLSAQGFSQMSLSLTHRPFCTRGFAAGLIIMTCDRDGIFHGYAGL